MSRGIRRARFWLSIAVLVGAAVAHLQEPALLLQMRNALFDAYQRLKPRAYQPAPVRIIDIDEESLKRLGQWPWPRNRVAALVQQLQRLGAAVTAFDVTFAEPDRTSPAKLVPDWGNEPALRRMLADLPDHDEQLREAVAAARVVTAFVLTDSSVQQTPLIKAGFATVGHDPRPFLPAFDGALTTLAPIEAAALGNGAVNIIRDLDGVGRRVPFFLRLGNAILPSLAAESLRVAQDAKSFVIKSSGASGEKSFGARSGIVNVRVGAFTVPTDAQGQIWMYFTPPVAERFIPAWKVLEGRVGREEIEGFILFLGTSAAGLHDIHATPLGLSMPGVVLHAQFLEQVLHGVYLTRPDWAKGAETFLIIVLGAVILLLGSRLGALWLAVIGGSVLAIAIATSWFAFASHSILLDPLFPALSIIATYLVWSLMSHMQTEREQRWVRTAFSSYLSPDLVAELVKHPERLKLGGERRELTFLFTDLEGFTSLVEQTAADVIVPLLNEYLDGMVRIAFQHGGTIDKIVGDALHVIFGAPLVQDDHAARAVACALEMDAFGQAFVETKRQQGIRFGVTRIGVNTGRAVIGNFGGSLRFDYTAHGDAINTAARLESVNKHLGTRICISGETVRLCPGFRGRPIGRLVLKGKSEGVETFEPLADGLADTEPMRAYCEAYRLLDQGDERARDAFARLADALADDPLVRFHWGRLQRGETTALVRMAEK